MNARIEVPLGIRHDIAIADYHASEGISNSGLSDFARSPFHYHALHLNPDRPPVEAKSGQLEGNLAHCAILEPNQFDKRYAAGPDISRATKLWAAFAESVPKGVYPIKGEQARVARAQAESVRSNRELARLLGTGRSEVTAAWLDQVTGELCRCRPDWVHPIDDAGVILVDVKTCSDASPDEFARQIGRKGYHRQAAFYSDGYQMASGTPVLAFIFAAVETAWPYAASAVMLDDESLERGRAENRALLDRFAACKRAGDWPGYSAGVELVSLPRWALTDPIPATATATEESTA